MVKNKIQRFAEIETFENVFHHLQMEKAIPDFHLKGNWRQAYFKNNNPLVLELGCGKGEYTIGLAEEFPAKNFVGIDLKGNRIWRGACTALENNMPNVAFLRTRIENIYTAFSKGEVSEIWITFPDPQPQLGRAKKRLTSPRFLDYYNTILIPGGTVHLKTDSKPLYEYTLETLQERKHTIIDSTDDLYGDTTQRNGSLKDIKTYYEQKFSKLGFKICYLSWTMPG